jgi:hypothetical protein
MKKAIIVLLILVFGLNVAAEDELKAKGVTVYKIFSVFPSQILDNYGILDGLPYNPVGYHPGPSALYTNSVNLTEISDRLHQWNCSEILDNNQISQNFPILNSQGILCSVNSTTLSYDGYWLIIQKESKENDTFTSFDALERRLSTQDDDLQKIYENFLKVTKLIPNSKSLTVIYLDEIYPNSLSNESSDACLSNPVAIRSRFSGVFGHLDRRNQINASVEIRDVCFSDGGRLKHSYYISLMHDVTENVLVIGRPQTQANEVPMILKTWDYLTYYPFVKASLTSFDQNTQELLSGLRKQRSDLINQTRFELNWSERKENLKNIRQRSLDLKESQINNLDNQLNLAKKFNDVLVFLNNPNNYFSRWDSALGTIFSNETSRDIDEMSHNYDYRLKSLDEIKYLQDDTRGIYYNELSLAAGEGAIYESWDMTNKSIAAAHIDTQNSLDIARKQAFSSNGIAIAAFLLTSLGIILSFGDQRFRDRIKSIFTLIICLLILAVMFQYLSSSMDIFPPYLLILVILLGLALSIFLLFITSPSPRRETHSTTPSSIRRRHYSIEGPRNR